jgi:NADH-quinone oxidoreductase subunit L
MTRQIKLVFFGQERFVHSVNAGFAPAHEEHDAADEHHAHGPVTPHESPLLMVLPLVVLAGLSIVGGAINLPWSKSVERLGNWLESARIPGTEAHSFVGEAHHGGSPKLVLALIAVAAGLIGIAIGWKAWGADPATSANLESPLLKKAYGVDAIYSKLIVAPGAALASFLAFVVDRKGIDGVVNGSGLAVRGIGGRLRKLQSGYVRNYALGLVGGLVALLAWGIYRGGF